MSTATWARILDLVTSAVVLVLAVVTLDEVTGGALRDSTRRLLEPSRRTEGPLPSPAEVSALLAEARAIVEGGSHG